MSSESGQESRNHVIHEDVFPLSEEEIRRHYDDYLDWAKHYLSVKELTYDEFSHECREYAPGFIPATIVWHKINSEGELVVHHKTYHQSREGHQRKPGFFYDGERIR